MDVEGLGFEAGEAIGGCGQNLPKALQILQAFV